MAENPNITELDSDYEPKENRAGEINGALPGECAGVRYWTKDDDGNLVPADGEPLSVENARTADIGIASSSSLESLSSDISAGDLVHIKQPDTPYRLSSWIDINASNVDIVFESRFAKNGEPVIKVADGGNVGGIRVGTGSTQITDVTIQNFGFHGNPTNQDSTVKRLHGVIFDNAKDCVLDAYFITRTHPYHEHNSGGSGVSCHNQSQSITITNGLIDDIGDRGIQLAGSEHRIEGNRAVNGFDRGTSLDVQQSDGSFYPAHDCKVIGNVYKDNSDGSCVAVSEVGATGNLVADNHMLGQFRGAVQFDNSNATNNEAVGNVVHHTATDNSQFVIVLGTRCVAEGNHIVNTTGSANGIFTSVGSDATIRNNYVEETGGCTIVRNPSADATVRNNELYASGGYGIQISNRAVVRENTVEGDGGSPAIFITGEGSVVADNFVDGNTNHGIDVQASDVEVANNRIVNFGSGGGKAGIITLNDTSLSGIVIRDNVGKTSNSPRAFIVGRTGSESVIGNTLLSSVTALDFDVTPHDVRGNDPAYYFDAAPSNPYSGQEVLASATWDPDGDGNGEKVVYDGTAWNEAADLPNV